MNELMKLLLLTGLLAPFCSCDMMEKVEERASIINKYENVALTLSSENRELRAEISRLHYDVEALKSKNNYLEIKLSKSTQKMMGSTPKRTIASVAPVTPQNDLVKFDVYKWTPSQVLAIAEKEFDQKHFEKSAQFFQAFSTKFLGHKKIDDQFLFQAGIAAYESGEHPEWVLAHLDKLISEYPTSKFYRGAKLWNALTHLKLGHEDKFFNTVEEFSKKYRNTHEWKILSAHYEKIVQKYKK